MSQNQIRVTVKRPSHTNNENTNKPKYPAKMNRLRELYVYKLHNVSVHFVETTSVDKLREY